MRKRTIHWTPEGIKWTADPKHAREIVTEWATFSGRSFGTPLIADMHAESSGEFLPPAEATRFRVAAARLQYLSHDRVDLSLAAQVLAMKMAKPRTSDVGILRRIANYVQRVPVLSMLFKWNSATSPVNELRVYTDSDWASCASSRRSRSGGVVSFNGHVVLHFSRM